MKEVLICCNIQKQVISGFHSFSNLSKLATISLTFFVELVKVEEKYFQLKIFENINTWELWNELPPHKLRVYLPIQAFNEGQKLSLPILR
ncbi:hypothetical protein pb186bvf_005355 [Paramecium bursaria]